MAKTLAHYIEQNFEDLQPMSANILGEGLDTPTDTAVGKAAIALIMQTEVLFLSLNETDQDKLNLDFEPIWDHVFNQIDTWIRG